jgi:pectate lyase
MNLFVLSSSSDYQVAIVDLDNDFDVSYINLKDIPYDGRAYSRQVEWVEDSNYVWIGGRQDDEAYVIDLSTKKMIKTFTDVDPRKLLSVAPHHFMGMADEYNNYFQENGALKGSSSAMRYGSDGGSNNTLSIAALAISIVAIAAVIASFFAAKKSSPASGGSAKQESAMSASVTGSKADASLAVPPSVA